MICQDAIKKVFENYGREVTVGMIGGHSAFDVCRGAKDEGLQTVVVCEKRRE